MRRTQFSLPSLPDLGSFRRPRRLPDLGSFRRPRRLPDLGSFRLPRRGRSNLGWTVAAIGALAALPLAYLAFTRRKRGAGQSPGHRMWPAHKVAEQALGQRVQVWAGGRLIADSQDVLRVEEDDYPARYYFPRSDVKMRELERSATTTHCPFKGTAHYFHLRLERGKLRDAVWTIEAPYDEHLALKDRLAFYDDKLPEIRIETLPLPESAYAGR